MQLGIASVMGEARRIKRNKIHPVIITLALSSCGQPRNTDQSLSTIPSCENLRQQGFTCNGVSPAATGPAASSATVNSNSTGLIAAAEAGDLNTVQALLAKGANVNETDRDGDTALIAASMHGNLQVVRAVLAKGSNVNAKERHGITALIAAAGAGHPDIVRVLIANGADLNAEAQAGGRVRTALSTAQANGNTQVMTVLLQAGAKR